MSPLVQTSGERTMSVFVSCESTVNVRYQATLILKCGIN